MRNQSILESLHPDHRVFNKREYMTQIMLDVLNRREQREETKAKTMVTQSTDASAQL